MASRADVVRYLSRQRRRQLANLSEYRLLIAAPEDLGTAAAGADLDPIKAAANAWLAVSLDDDTDPGDISVGTRQTLGAAADVLQPIGYYERGTPIVITRAAGAPAGILTLYVYDEWRRPYAIATGEFT